LLIPAASMSFPRLISKSCASASVRVISDAKFSETGVWYMASKLRKLDLTSSAYSSSFLMYFLEGALLRRLIAAKSIYIILMNQTITQITYSSEKFAKLNSFGLEPDRLSSYILHSLLIVDLKSTETQLKLNFKQHLLGQLPRLFLILLPEPILSILQNLIKPDQILINFLHEVENLRGSFDAVLIYTKLPKFISI
jgi:hypothetical protein